MKFFCLVLSILLSNSYCEEVSRTHALLKEPRQIAPQTNEQTISRLEKDLLLISMKDYEERVVEVKRAKLPEDNIHPLAPYRFFISKNLYEQKLGPKLPIRFLDREQGIKEIHKRISIEEQESTWVFLSEIPAWINDTMIQEDTSVAGDPDLRAFLSKKFSSLEWFHTHPDKVINDVMKIKKKPAFWMRTGAMPSDADFACYQKVAHNAPTTTRFKGSIVSHYGVTTFEATEENRKANYMGSQGMKFPEVLDEKAAPLKQIQQLLKAEEQDGYINKYLPEIVIPFKIEFSPL